MTRRRRWMVARIVLAVAMITLLVWRYLSIQPSVIEVDDGPAVLVGRGHWLLSSGSEASASGELAVVDGCLGIDGEGGGTVVIWPNGTSVRSDDPLIVRVHGQDYALGDQIAVGGGSGPLTDVFDDPPKSCGSSGAFIANPSE